MKNNKMCNFFVFPPSCLRAFVPSCLIFLLSGCVEQTMTIESTPPGALVYLNNQEIGRTPVTRDFKWYGDYDVQVRLEGYQTLNTHHDISSPVWNWVPFDLISAALPWTFKDHHDLSFALEPLDPAKDQPEGLLSRAEDLKAQVEGSPFTRVATPRAATRPGTTRPATQPAK